MSFHNLLNPLGLNRWKTIKPLWQALSHRRRRQLVLFVPLSLLCAVAEVGNVGSLLPFLKVLSSPSDGLSSLGPWAQPLQSLDRQQVLIILGLCFLILVILSSGLRLLTILVQLRLTALVGADLGRLVLSNVLHRPYLWHLNHNSSEVLTVISQDVEGVVSSVQSLLGLVANSLIVVLLFAALIKIAPSVTIIVGVLIATVYVVIYMFLHSGLYKDGQIYALNNQLTFQAIQESLGGIRDIQLDRSHPFFLSRFDKSNRSRRLASGRINAKAQAPRYLIEGAIMIIVVGLSLALALKGEGVEKQLPLLGTLALGAYRILMPVQQCFGTITGFKGNQASLQRIAPYLESSLPSGACVDVSSKLVPSPVFGDITLKQVSFRFDPEGPLVLDSLQLVIPSGSRVALVGSTGSGKSTTIDLILGLLTPVKGQVLIGNRDLHVIPGLLAQWQRHIGHVPQQIYLSDSSFAENIAFGIDPARIDQRRVEDAAHKARISELIEGYSNGYNTIVGERGIRLSGGQRQRLGIARALYKQSLVLVLDEATSALDNQTEQEVMAAIEGLHDSLTVIMIAHRLSTVQCCDAIHVMEHGRITASGTYAELIKDSPRFRLLASTKSQEDSPNSAALSS